MPFMWDETEQTIESILASLLRGKWQQSATVPARASNMPVRVKVMVFLCSLFKCMASCDADGTNMDKQKGS